ncbi:Demethylrebeccamycin-D-glucose O-methyltransferase [Posidoniimonas polymericola]|uniref:Demethylrebeccamycin-D-glucose O-methyltransferase n=1 Tax=Posidoniimonas polymericola TaxID=2528002 RepID=A0A5C5YKT8_9BACT|nr:class I SAM-dependent methyltransferase [Posidoniimonas polymericola]TWT75530.1 Demethylrebeccamycin-D-glucose O-methyltransferase [Posidoniimonas polymericola]
MISCPGIQKKTIRRHYNVSTLFYRLLWGRHIHHGYWDADESPEVAQDQLTDKLAAAASIARGSRVVDIGCGMGGSSRRLAKLHDCHVTGVTISPFQKRWASLAATRHGLRSRTRFLCADAEQVEFRPGEFDAVWSIECTEHLTDKPEFVRRAAEWVKPGGAMAICAWLAGPDLDEAKRQQVYDVCEGMFCPSLATSAEYQQWMRDAGLEVEVAEDWTRNVDRTWEICRDRVLRFRMYGAAKLIDRQQIIFLDRFQTILDAYRSGAMEYGCFVARKPQ